LFARSQDIDEIPKVGKSTKKVKVNLPWHTLREQIFFPKILEKEKLDLVHFPYFSIPIKYKGNYVITIHDLILHHFATGKASRLPFPFYSLKHQAYKKIISTAAKNSKKIIVPSLFVKNDVRNTLGVDEEKIVVTYEGVDEGLGKGVDEKIDLLENIPFLLYVGNAYPHKNLQFLTESFKQFQKEYPEHANHHLVLVGKKDYFYDRLDKAIFHSSIVHLTEVSDEQLKWLYMNAKAFVNPSLSEGFSLPSIEALSLKCLVLLSAIPVHREICGKWAIYFDPTNSDDLVGKIKDLSQLSEQEVKIYQQNGSRHVRKYSWRNLAKETLKIYESSEARVGPYTSSNVSSPKNEFESSL